MDNLADNTSKRYTATKSFSVSIEDSIQGFVMVDGFEFILPAQLQTWAKFALECWITTGTGRYYIDGNGYSLYKPDITIEYANGTVRKIYVTASRNENHHPLHSASP